MLKLDWNYHRHSCTSCARTQEFLTNHGIGTTQQVDARKQAIPPAEALALARSVDHLYVIKAQKVVHYDLKNHPPSDDELLAAIVGRSGSLRAPAVRRGRTLIVGFDADTYRDVLA